MPEDIPEPAIKLTEDEKLSRASDWSDYRKDYGVSSDERELKKQHSLFCAGWDEGFVHGKWAARKDAAAYAQAEEDARLGRWRWPENPDYVVYHAQNVNGDHRVINLSNGDAMLWGRDMDPSPQSTDLVECAAHAYFDAHPEPKPWHDAKPGEIWALGIGGGYHGDSITVVEVDGDRRFIWHVGGDNGLRNIPVRDRSIDYGRRVWPEDAS